MKNLKCLTIIISVLSSLVATASAAKKSPWSIQSSVSYWGWAESYRYSSASGYSTGFPGESHGLCVGVGANYALKHFEFGALPCFLMANTAISSTDVTIRYTQRAVQTRGAILQLSARWFIPQAMGTYLGFGLPVIYRPNTPPPPGDPLATVDGSSDFALAAMGSLGLRRGWFEFNVGGGYSMSFNGPLWTTALNVNIPL